MLEEDKPIVLGPWPRGLVNAVDERSVPLDGLVTATNVDIDRDGDVTTRSKWDLLDAVGYSSIVEHNSTVYAERLNTVGIVGESSFDSIASVAGPVNWTVLDGNLVFTDGMENRIIYGTNDVQPLPEGHYLDDEETEFQLAPLPAGSEIHAWQGRLLVVRGNSLIWSEPMRYGIYSAARNFIRFGERVIWAAPLSTGVYVGLRNSVVFLEGSNPYEFRMRTVGQKSAPGAATVYDTRHRGEGGQELALWFTDVGIAVGQASGSVAYPQAERLRGLPLLPGKMVVENDRVYIFTTQEH